MSLENYLKEKEGIDGGVKRLYKEVSVWLRDAFSGETNPAYSVFSYNLAGKLPEILQNKPLLKSEEDWQKKIVSLHSKSKKTKEFEKYKKEFERLDESYKNLRLNCFVSIQYYFNVCIDKNIKTLELEIEKEKLMRDKYCKLSHDNVKILSKRKDALKTIKIPERDIQTYLKRAEAIFDVVNGLINTNKSEDILKIIEEDKEIKKFDKKISKKTDELSSLDVPNEFKLLEKYFN